MVAIPPHRDPTSSPTLDATCCPLTSAFSWAVFSDIGEVFFRLSWNALEPQCLFHRGRSLTKGTVCAKVNNHSGTSSRDGALI